MFEELRTLYNVRYIRTNSLNQDVCENFFSRLRALGISDDHPGV